LNRYKYCILNKQYKKEEYFELKKKLIEHMKKTGEWGEFFPASIAPWAYNETVAQEYMPISKEEALKKGYGWKEDQVSGGKSGEVADDVVACAGCSKHFKLIPQELRFYKERVLPVPRKCPDCRHLDRIAIRTPRSLWKKACGKCGTQNWTTYSLDRPEKVYCDECYEGEVY
jgi:hypothetical protein